jgi:uncharacterized protein YjbJ (UPF0337 family)
MKSSTKDSVEGQLHLVKGKIKEAAGVLVSDSSLEAEGKVEQLAGKIQQKVGEVEKKLGD